MTGFTPVFPGTAIYPSDVTLLSLDPMTEDTTLSWPNQQQNDGLVAAAIVEANASAGLSIILSDARQVANGYTSLFNNIGSNTFSVKDAGGNTLMTVASGEAWELYLYDNSTEDGAWRVFQYGAGASSANAGALAGAGLKAITTTLNQRMLPSIKSTDYPIVNADRAKIIQWEGGVGTLTLPNPATVGNDWFVGVKNAGTGTIALAASSGLIDDAASLSLPPGESTYVYSDGTDMWTFGLGQAVNSVFDFISIAIPGTGDYTLSGAQLNRVSYRFTGILTGDRNIIVPNTVQQYWVDNQTTGAFTLTVKTIAGSGVLVPQTRRSILYSDGTNVVNAETFIVSTPVAIADGGTGQVTAVTALAALGGAPLTRILTAGSGLTGGGDLSADRTFAVGAGTGISVNADDVALDVASPRNVDHTAVVLTAGAGMAGGGDISASRSFDIGAGSGILVNANDVALDTTNFRNVDHSAVSIGAGAGLTGGGDISANRTLNVGAGAGIVVNTDDVALDPADTRNVAHDTVAFTGTNSITGGGQLTASQTFQLDGDAASPGLSQYYGTDAAGVKGFFALPAAGAGRTWQNVAGARSLNTNFTNSTGGEIEVNFSGVCDSGSAQTMLVDGITVGGSGQNTSTGSMSISATVPNGSVYRVNGSAAGGSFTWAELRP